MEVDIYRLKEAKTHVWLPIKKRKTKILIKNIIRLEAFSNYTRFYVKGYKGLIIVSKTLKYYQEKLEDQHFIRTHQSHLVNWAYVANYSDQKGGCLILKDATQIEISRRKKSCVLNHLSIKKMSLRSERLVYKKN